MQVSARILGNEYGLTAEEMNCVLKKLGFLSGEAGDYYLTEKGMEYAKEHEHNSGCGGYSIYNRYWTTRTYDDSIMDVLDITPELKSEVREELKVARAAKRAAEKFAMQQAEEKYLAEQAANEAAEIEALEAQRKREENIELIKNGGKTMVIVLLIAGSVYTVYKVATHIKKRKEAQNDKCEETEKEVTQREGVRELRRRELRVREFGGRELRKGEHPGRTLGGEEFRERKLVTRVEMRHSLTMGWFKKKYPQKQQ